MRRKRAFQAEGTVHGKVGRQSSSKTAPGFKKDVNTLAVNLKEWVSGKRQEVSGKL